MARRTSYKERRTSFGVFLTNNNPDDMLAARLETNVIVLGQGGKLRETRFMNTGACSLYEMKNLHVL